MESLAKEPLADEGPSESPAPGSKGSSAPAAVAGVGERVQAILDDAERAAAEIRAEAEAQSAEYLAERRREADRLVEERLESLGELTEALSARAAAVERDASELAAEVKDALGRLKGAGGAGASFKSISAAGGAEVPEQAVLRATQMAVTGADRAEISKTLTDEFGLTDPAPILDQVLDSKPA